jgi:hypothetical protein
MASVALDVGILERRVDRRVAGGGSRFGDSAVVRPGQAVALVNICRRGALIESAARLRPGAHTELQLFTGTSRARVTGRLDRCQVVRLDPIAYRAVIVFDECLDIGLGDKGSE